VAGGALLAIPIRGLGEFHAGSRLCEEILDALRRQKLRPLPGDILVVTHKIVSKTEGRVVRLAEVRPSRKAANWARRHGLDGRVVELALRESRRVVRMRRGVLITQTRHGLVCANSGVDLSNVDGGGSAALLPEDPDRSAARLHRQLRARLGFAVPVLVSDSFGRPWRQGLCEFAVGAAGMNVFRDFRGRRDPHGYRLRVTREAVADELAGVAGLACDKLSRSPVCLVRGFAYQPAAGRARDLVRPAGRDLFR